MAKKGTVWRYEEVDDFVEPKQLEQISSQDSRKKVVSRLWDALNENKNVYLVWPTQPDTPGTSIYISFYSRYDNVDNVSPKQCAQLNFHDDLSRRKISSDIEFESESESGSDDENESDDAGPEKPSWAY